MKTPVTDNLGEMFRSIDQFNLQEMNILIGLNDLKLELWVVFRGQDLIVHLI